MAKAAIRTYAMAPSYHEADGEPVSKSELEDGDEVALRVSWFGDFDEAVSRPTIFEVTETWDHIDDVLLEGDDGHTYKLYDSRVTVECLSDDKKGKHRGNLAGRVKRLN